MTDHDKSHASTHADDCWSWGRGHYECAVGKIERLQAEVERLWAEVAKWKHSASLQAELRKEAEARADDLATALRNCQKLARNCYPEELPSAIITTASKAVAEYDMLRRLRRKPTAPSHLKEQP